MNAPQPAHPKSLHHAESQAPDTPRGELVPRLYVALAEQLRATDDAIIQRNAEQKSRHLEAAVAVVFELIASIDFERGGELAPRLAALYGYFSSELLYIARTEDRQQIASLLDMIGVLTETWHVGAPQIAS